MCTELDCVLLTDETAAWTDLPLFLHQLIFLVLLGHFGFGRIFVLKVVVAQPHGFCMDFCQFSAGVVEVEAQYFFKFLPIGSIGALNLDIKLGEGVETKLVAVFLAEIPLNL